MTNHYRVVEVETHPRCPRCSNDFAPAGIVVIEQHDTSTGCPTCKGRLTRRGNSAWFVDEHGRGVLIPEATPTASV